MLLPPGATDADLLRLSVAESDTIAEAELIADADVAFARFEKEVVNRTEGFGRLGIDDFKATSAAPHQDVVALSGPTTLEGRHWVRDTGDRAIGWRPQ
jgi:hypothetical protein